MKKKPSKNLVFFAVSFEGKFQSSLNITKKRHSLRDLRLEWLEWRKKLRNLASATGKCKKFLRLKRVKNKQFEAG